jgi:hypothetical protein
MRSAFVTYTVCCIENAPSQVIHRFQKFVNVFISINVRARNIIESGWPVAHDVFTVDVFLAEKICSLGEAIFWVTCGCSEYAYSWEASSPSTYPYSAKPAACTCPYALSFCPSFPHPSSSVPPPFSFYPPPLSSSCRRPSSCVRLSSVS